MKNVLYAFIFLAGLSVKAQEIKWYTVEEAYELTKTEPKMILIDVYTDWCGWCKKMDKDTYAKEKIAKYLNDNFYPVKFNAEQKDSINILDHTFKFIQEGRRGYHELAAALLNGQMSYPSTVFMTKSFEMIQNVPGYLDEKTMYPILVYLYEGHYETTPYETFLEDFKQ